MRKDSILSGDLQTLERLRQNLIEQKDLHEQDVSLSREAIDADNELRRDSVISRQDYRLEQSKLIGKQMTLSQLNAGIINNDGEQNDKRKEILELRNTFQQQKIVFSEAVNTFVSQIDEWERNFLLTAPIDGRVVFERLIQEQQQVHANQIICYISPVEPVYFAQVVIPQANLGKVHVGQKVLLKFSSYQYREFGSLKGTITFLSNISSDSGYWAKVELPKHLVTNYNKEIIFRNGLAADAEIITGETRLFTSVFNVFRPQ